MLQWKCRRRLSLLLNSVKLWLTLTKVGRFFHNKLPQTSRSSDDHVLYLLYANGDFCQCAARHKWHDFSVKYLHKIWVCFHQSFTDLYCQNVKVFLMYKDFITKRMYLVIQFIINKNDLEEWILQIFFIKPLPANIRIWGALKKLNLIEAFASSLAFAVNRNGVIWGKAQSLHETFLHNSIICFLNVSLLAIVTPRNLTSLIDEIFLLSIFKTCEWDISSLL